MGELAHGATGVLDDSVGTNGQATQTDAWPVPDFYEYPWVPLTDVRPTERRTVHLTWSDGSTLECHIIWLRENAHCENGIHPVTRETTLDVATISKDLSVSNAQIVDGGLELTFEPEHCSSRFHPGWLHHVATGRHQIYESLPSPQPWTTETLPAPQEADATALLTDADALTDALLAVARDGMVLLKGCDDDEGFVERVAFRIGRPRDNLFGKLFKVEIDPAADSLALTSHRLSPHADLSSMETPPGLQLLHCLQNNVVGGEFLLTDGLAVLEHIRRHQPHLVEPLTTLKWIFFNRTPAYDMRTCRPIVDAAPTVVGWDFCVAHLRAFPAMDVTDVELAYEVMNAFNATTSDPAFQMSHRFEPGEMIVLDNRRMLHGRNAFTVGPDSWRRLSGTYVETDEFYSTLRVLLRARGGEAPNVEERLAARR